MSEKERINFALRQVEMIYPGMREALRGRRDKMLGRGQWGARRQFLLQAGAIQFPAATRREARSQNSFRGEHTSVWIDGWMQGTRIGQPRRAE